MAPVSYLSLLSQWEQLAEWVSDAVDPSQIFSAGVTTEYELLMYVGMLGFPINVHRSAAAQMDPFQISISAVHAAPADSASLCCALQSEQSISAPEGGEVKDLLLLVDPDCPEASRIALKCRLFDLYTSVVLCRDLHMYSGVHMRIALHAHALVSLIGNRTPTKADLDIALRICYSVRKIWEDVPDSQKEYENLLCRLLQWDELTAADGVNDTSQLLLALTALCDNNCANYGIAAPAVLMLVNETLSRHARVHFRSQAGGEASQAKIRAITCVRGFLGVTDDSAPQAQEQDEPEPLQAEVEAMCRRDVKLDRGAFDFQHWVLDKTQPVLHAVAFATALRGALAQRGGGWEQLEADMEAGHAAYADVLTSVHARTETAELPKACDFGGEALERVCATMAAQAMLCSDSCERHNLPDVREADTLRQIAVRLRMDTYAGHVAAKMRDWRAVALDVTAARARAADIGQFQAMLGSHAHGLSKGAFWGLWDAAKHDGYGGEKVRAFLESANGEFANKYGSKDCATSSKR